MHVLVDCEFGVGVGIELIAAIDKVQVADNLACIVVLDDVKIFRRHQPADNLMDPRQHLVHFKTTAGEIGNFIKCLLQAF